MSGQVAVAIRFLTRDPSLIWNTGYGGNECIRKQPTYMRSPSYLTILLQTLYFYYSTVADPDLELRGGGGIFPSVISSFLPKIRGGRRPGPSPRSATVPRHMPWVFSNILTKRGHWITKVITDYPAEDLTSAVISYGAFKEVAQGMNCLSEWHRG